MLETRKTMELIAGGNIVPNPFQPTPKAKVKLSKRYNMPTGETSPNHEENFMHNSLLGSSIFTTNSKYKAANVSFDGTSDAKKSGNEWVK